MAIELHQLKPETRLRLLSADSDTDLWKAILFRVDKDRLALVADGRMPPWREGTQARIQVANDLGLHTLPVEVLSIDTQLLTVKATGPFSTKQERRYFRVSLNEQIEIFRVGGVIKDKSIPASAIDLSIGGIGLHLSEPLDFESRIRIHRSPKNEADAAFELLEASVRYCNPLQPALFSVGMQFEPMSLRDQDRIARWVMTLQRKRSI